jgi:hypothetical protein
MSNIDLSHESAWTRFQTRHLMNRCSHFHLFFNGVLRLERPFMTARQ